MGGLGWNSTLVPEQLLKYWRTISIAFSSADYNFIIINNTVNTLRSHNDDNNKDILL